MSTIDDPPPASFDEDSRSRGSKPAKEKKRRRRSKQKESIASEGQGLDQELIGLEDEGDNSCSSTPKYERFEEPLYPAGGLLCALCYCGEKSLLGQGDLTRYSPSPGFNPFKKPPLRARGSRELLYGSSPGSNGSQENVGEKVTKTAAQRRGSKQMRETIKITHRPPEHVDELSTVGCSEMLDVSQVFEPAGHVSAHHCCAAWSEGVTQNESYNLLCVDKAVHAGMSQRCHCCSRYGATIKCRAPKCERLFHYPCAAGSGCYQDIKSMSLLCTDHLELAPTIADPDELNCAVCDSPGQISDLLFCTSCGHHYHGDCLDPHVDVNPVVRAGWQCPECKICQTCRQPGDDNKMLVCDVCDKGYHTFCLRPAMTFIPKNGWCCKICRRCTDCGSRTPGNGPSSRWHINYQVCDSCYQLRNKGSSCPVCSKAYRNIPSARLEMTQCTGCKKWVHWTCEEASHYEECQKQPENYKCPKCRNPELAQQPPAVVPQPIEIEPPAEEPSAPQDLSIASLPVSEPGTSESVPGDIEMKTEFHKPPSTPPAPISRKRASTSSSIGSEKGNFALKGSSLDPMLCLGDAGDPKLNSPPRKVRHISSDEALSARDRAERQSSAESNLSSLFTDENAQDAMSLFGVDTLPHSAPRSVPLTTPPVLVSPDAKTFRVAEGFVMPVQPKVTLSPLASPQSYLASPQPKPPGPGIGKPGAMFGKGKPFGHKRKPRGKGGKGKGKGQKKGSFSGARKRPKGGKGSNAYTPAERNLPRRARRAGLQKQASGSPSVGDEPLGSPVSKMEPVLQVAQADDEYGDSMHNTVVLCSTEDTFTLCQDMCVVCGSFGKGSEGRLISCSQCGQCYHPYCVNLKLTKVVLRKGWRCLDCTVCEECGQVDDPAHLLLCDDCDISYHTHCLKPPLQHVPKGGWKCKWCVRCVHCGTTSPGKNCEWASNYTSCGPCASLNHCPRCRRSYKDEDVIMQCQTCERWIHAVCECLYTESDIERVLEKGYDCVFCRPKDAIPPHLTLEPQPGDPNYKEQSDVYMGRTRSEVEAVKEYHKDCTALTIAGLQHIQKQMQKHMGLFKKRPAPARRGSRKPSENQERMEPPHVLPTLESLKAKEPLGQPINVAAAVQALQDPSEIYRKLSEDGSGKGLVEGAFPMARQLPIATGAIEDLSSATATATEDSGMEGVERDLNAMRPEDIKSPMGETDPSAPKPADFLMQPPIPDPTKAVLGIQQGAIKRRRKPYRPGIGGFMIRQRGRGGGLLKPRSRRTPAPAQKDSAEGSKTDAITTETASDAVPPATPGQTLPGGQTPGVPQEGAMPLVQSTPGGDQFTPPTGPGSVVSPVKLKLSSSSSSTKRRKKKMKLIEQFPQYLQDAFFGKEVLTVAENKATPFDNLNERPASPGTGYGSKQSGDSRLVLPDRLTQRLEMQAAVANASQRSAQRLQDEESMLMDRENEQELLGVLPDLPFKDDELIGMISSELKQEQGTNDPHENILSPSSLEKMVSDGLDGLQNIGDVAALFSDVLNNQPDGATKQDNLQHQHGEIHGSSQMDQTAQAQHGSLQETTNVHTGPQTSIHIQQNVTQQQQLEQYRQLAIQQELQQIETKQRQQQHLRQQQQQRQHVIQRQMSANIPPTGYGMTQQDQVMGGHHMINMGQGRVVSGQSVTPGPHGMTLVAQQHVDPTRPHSHHTTPVMSPVPMMGQQQQGHPMPGMHHPSPHPTPPPQPMFGRQVSMPVLSHTGMPSPSATPDMLTGAPVHQQMQGQVNQNLMTQQVTQAKAMQRIQTHAATPSAPDAQGFPTATRPSTLFPEQSQMSMKQTPSNVVPQAGSNQAEAILQNQSQALHRFHSVTDQLPQGQRTPLPTEAYHVLPAEAPSTQASSHPTHKRSSSVPVPPAATSSLGMPHGSGQAPPSSSAVSTPQPVASSMSTPTAATASEASDSLLSASQLPNFPSSQLFEPSPLPWPLGTDLENENPSVNQRNVLKWEKDEPLGELSTISPVLYANVKYPDLKKEFPEWQARAKQIAKLWRKASTDERAPFLQKAKDNRALLKLNRARRGELSKTPTPPIATEEQESKAHQSLTEASRLEITDLALSAQSSVPIGPVSQSQAPTQGHVITTSSVASATSTTEEYAFAKPSSRTTTPKPQSPAAATQLSADPALSVKQQSMPVPVSAYFASQVSESTKMETLAVAQSPMKLIQAKVERRVSLDTPSQAVGPYPQSKMPATSQESPSKTPGAAGVTRSLSLGAAFSDNANTQGSLQTPPMDPKNRRLSVDSQVLQMQSAIDQDLKPNISTSPTPAQIRQVIYQQTTQRSSRRARLWEQSQPPPPYPSASSSAPSASQGFRYPQIGPRGQVVQISGSAVGVLSPGGTQALIRAPSPGLHNPGMIAFRLEGGQQQSGTPGHPVGQPHPGYPAGVHPVMKGFNSQHPPGAYIELRHTNQSDAATRRQNILRMTNVCMAGPTTPQTQPGTPVSTQPIVTESGQPAVTVKTESPAPAPESAVEGKADDPFAGGHMPHDEHLDALLRSDEFKDLHFQGPTSTVLPDKGADKPAETPTSESSATSDKGQDKSTDTAVSESSAVPQAHSARPTSGLDPTPKDAPTAEKVDVNTKNDDPSAPEEKQPFDTMPSSDAKESTALADQTTPAVTEDKKDEASVDEGTKKDLPVILKNDHSYSKAVDGKTESKTVEASESATTSVIKEPLKAKTSLGVDMTSKDQGQDPRGVGLTPPPESQVGFIPAEVEKPDASLIVSNVITVPGTPPSNTLPGKTAVEPQDLTKLDSDNKLPSEPETKQVEDSADISSTIVEKKSAIDSQTDTSEKGKLEGSKAGMKLDLTSATSCSPLPTYDLPPLPKSPVAPPMVQKLSKFAKIPDPVLSTQIQEDADKDQTKTIEETSTTESVKKDTELQVAGGHETDIPTSRPQEDLNKDVEMDADLSQAENPSVKNQESKSISELETKPLPHEKENLTATSIGDKETPPEETITASRPAVSGSEKDESFPMEVTESVSEKDARSQEKRKDEIDSGSADQNKAKATSTDADVARTQVTSSNITQTTIVSPPMTHLPQTPSEQTPTPSDLSKTSVHLPTTSVIQPVSASVIQQPAVATVQSLMTQSSEISHSVSMVTVTQTPLATVTAYRQPVMTSAATLNMASTITVSAAHQVHPSIQQLPEQAQAQSHPVPPSTMAGSVTPTRPVRSSPHLGVPAPMPQTHVTPNKDGTKVTPPRQKPLLIKEQPLLLQELMEEEKREQEKARREKMRHTQTLLQQQAVQPPGLPGAVYPVQGVEGMEKVTPDSGIDTIKMEFLSRMNQAAQAQAQAGLPVVPPTVPEGSLGTPGATTMLPQQQTWGAQVPGAGLQQAGTTGFANEAELRKYRNWLIQQQQLMQIQVTKQEQLVQAKKTRKQSLQKKKNQYKRNGKEFSAEDTEELRNVTKQYTEAQQQLEKLRNDQNQHAKLIQDFNIRQRHMLATVSTVGQPGMVQQPQGQVAPGIDGQQQHILIQHPGATSVQAQHQPQTQQIVVPQYQSPGLQHATQNVPQQQIMMMQQGPQQQLIIKSIPASTNITGTPSTTATSVAMGIQQQPQQTQVVMQTQQQKQALVAQFQKIAGPSPNPAQIQQIMINQQLVQQQQLQQQQQQQKLQQTMKVPQQQLQFMPPQSGTSSPAAAPAFTATSNQTHNALMQMQMQQLMALQIEQQQNLAFQQQNPEKAKPKRRRRKKKSQAEKEEEERKQAMGAQQQHKMQSPTRGVVPSPGQHPGTGWQHRPAAPPGAMSQVIQQQMMTHQHPRFSHPGAMGQLQSGLPSSAVPGVTPSPQTYPTLSGSSHIAAPSVLQSPSTTTQVQPGAQGIMSMTPTTGLSQSASSASLIPTAVSNSTSEVQRTQPGVPAPLITTASTIMSSTVVTATGIASAPITTPGTMQSMAPQSVTKLTTSTPSLHHAPIGMPAAQSQYAAHASLPSSSVLKSTPPKNVYSTPTLTASQVPLAAMQAQHQMSGAADDQKAIAPQAAAMLGTVGAPVTPQQVPSGAMPGSMVTPASAATPSRPSSGPSTPRTRSPGRSPAHAGGSFEGLSEAEIAILMAHDPDLNQESGILTPVAAPAKHTPTNVPPLTLTPDQDDKLGTDESKKNLKRPKKGYVMDQKTIDTIDDCIEKVVWLSADYEDRIQAAKGQEGAKTPSPWELDPKPTKFPAKKTHEPPSMGLKEGMKGMFGHSSMSYAPTHILQGLPSDVMAYGPMQPGMSMMPYTIKPANTEDPSHKKKRSRRGSKEVGPDGKPIKRRRKKTKDTPQQQQQFQMGPMVDGNMQGMMMQTMQPTMQGTWRIRNHL